MTRRRKTADQSLLKKTRDWLVHGLIGARELIHSLISLKANGTADCTILLSNIQLSYALVIKHLSNRPHFLWVYRRDNQRGILGEHEKS